MPRMTSPSAELDGDRAAARRRRASSSGSVRGKNTAFSADERDSPPSPSSSRVTVNDLAASASIARERRALGAAVAIAQHHLRSSFHQKSSSPQRSWR